MVTKDQIEALRALNDQQNDGRGVVCVHSIISCLEEGDIDEAIAGYLWDNDKTASYPELDNLLSKVLGVPTRYGWFSVKVE